MKEDKNKKYKVFIIDDDNFMLDMYAVKFKEQGFDVTVSIDSKKALEKLREGFSPDLILFDIIMPVMDGIELLKIIRKEKLAEKTIFIALSNQWKVSDMEKAKEFGAEDYIIKANTIPSEVLDRVKSILARHNKN